jgi:hypothetical protein
MEPTTKQHGTRRTPLIIIATAVRAGAYPAATWITASPCTRSRPEPVAVHTTRKLFREPRGAPHLGRKRRKGVSAAAARWAPRQPLVAPLAVAGDADGSSSGQAARAVGSRHVRTLLSGLGCAAGSDSSVRVARRVGATAPGPGTVPQLVRSPPPVRLVQQGRCGVSGWRNTGPGNVRSDCVRWWYELVLLHCLLYAVYAHVRGQRKCQLYPRVSAATVAHYVQVQPLSCQRTFAFFEQSVCLTSPSLFPHLLFPSVSRVSKMIGTFC